MGDPYYEQYIDLTRRMRQAQKDYFAHRQSETLALSKELEMQVDRFLYKHGTPDLFREGEQQ